MTAPWSVTNRMPPTTPHRCGYTANGIAVRPMSDSGASATACAWAATWFGHRCANSTNPNPTGRIADAHESSGGVHGALTALGIDIAELNERHGRALDRVFDAVIAALAVVEEQIDHLRGRQA